MTKDQIETQRDRPAERIAGVLAALLLVVVLLYLGRAFFITLISAILLAFILDPIVNLFMRVRVPRGAASFLACSLMLAVLYLLGLGIWTQAVGLWEELPTYGRRVSELVDAGAQQLESFEKTAQDILVPKRLRPAAPEPADSKARTSKQRRTAPASPPAVQDVRIQNDQSRLVETLYKHIGDFYDAALMASFVPFLVYFLLSWRDHFRRTFLHLLGAEGKKENVQRAWDGIAGVARAYLVGNFLLAVVLSIASAAFFWFVKLPYWQVIGPMSGFLSLVPYLGMLLALVPPVIAALPVYTALPPYLLIGAVTAVLHLIALNLLYPKLVGARVHLNPLVVTVALMLWYLIWGGAGLVLAIPITAGLKAAFDNIPSMRAYGRLLGD